MSNRAPLQVNVPSIKAIYGGLVGYPTDEGLGFLMELYQQYNPKLGESILKLKPDIQFTFFSSSSSDAAMTYIQSNAKSKYQDCDSIFQPFTVTLQNPQTRRLSKVDCVLATYVKSIKSTPALVVGDMLLVPAKAGNSQCFIATACYGTPSAPEIQILRSFRDDYLVNFPLGRAFIRSYSAIGPYLAAVISNSAVLRSTVRILLIQPLVKLIARIEEKA